MKQNSLFEMKPKEEIWLNMHNGFELLSSIVLEDAQCLSFSHNWNENICSLEDGLPDYQTNFFAIENDIEKVNKILHKYYKTHLWKYKREHKGSIQRNRAWRFTRKPIKPLIFSSNHPEGIPVCGMGSGEDYYGGDNNPTPLPVYVHRHMNGWVYGKTSTNLAFRFEKDCHNSWIIFGSEQLGKMWDWLFVEGRMLGHKESSATFHMSKNPLVYRRVNNLEDLK